MRRACLAAAFFIWACSPAAGEDVSETSSAEIRSAARVCSWNMRRLGHLFDGRPKDIDAAASIITEHCDVIAVQEVMQSNGATPGYVALLDALGRRWEGVITERPQPDDPIASSSEHYAFYFRKAAAALCSGWSGVRQLRDDEGTFQREPAWTCLKVKGHRPDLLLVTYHAIFGSAVERRREVGALDADLNRDGQRGDVLRAVQASRSGNPDVVMVGDFNLTPTDLAAELPGWKDLTAGSGSTLNVRDEITANLYDHVVIPPDQPLLAGLQPAEVLDVRQFAHDDTFVRSISDHLPIRFALRAPGTPAEP